MAQGLSRFLLTTEALLIGPRAPRPAATGRPAIAHHVIIVSSLAVFDDTIGRGCFMIMSDWFVVPLGTSFLGLGVVVGFAVAVLGLPTLG